MYGIQSSFTTMSTINGRYVYYTIIYHTTLRESIGDVINDYCCLAKSNYSNTQHSFSQLETALHSAHEVTYPAASSSRLNELSIIPYIDISFTDITSLATPNRE